MVSWSGDSCRAINDVAFSLSAAAGSGSMSARDQSMLHAFAVAQYSQGRESWDSSIRGILILSLLPTVQRSGLVVVGLVVDC